MNVTRCLLVISFGLLLVPGPVLAAGTHSYRFVARSPQVIRGKAYPFRLYTHCGASFLVDFDHSLWDLTDKKWADTVYPDGSAAPHRGLANPFQNGWMTLVDYNHARFDFTKQVPAGPGGVGTRQHIRFSRHRGAKYVRGYCS